MNFLFGPAPAPAPVVRFRSLNSLRRLPRVCPSLSDGVALILGSLSAAQSANAQTAASVQVMRDHVVTMTKREAKVQGVRHRRSPPLDTHAGAKRTPVGLCFVACRRSTF